LYPILLHRDGAQVMTYGGPTETPPHTQPTWGLGTVDAEENSAARSCDLSHDRAARSRDNTRAERGVPIAS